MNILIAEDDQVARDLLKAQLEADGHTVRTATDGIQAFGMMENNQSTDLVIADGHMPMLDG